MNRLLAAGVLVLTALGVAWAENFVDEDLRIGFVAPKEFVRSQDPLEPSDALGQPKALFLSPDAAETGGMLVVHHMDIPGGDYDNFKGLFADQLAGVFGEAYQVVEQKDVKLGDREGFVLEFKCNGDGLRPKPDGDIPHRVRWRFIRDGDSKLIGLIYTARESAWETMKPKFTASERTLKTVE